MRATLADFWRVLQQAFHLNPRPIPYRKAILAGLAAALPVLIGQLLGYFQHGLIASLGGFAFLYVFHMPYWHIAKKTTWMLIGLSLCAFFGSFFAHSPILLSLGMALIASIMVFCFGTLNIAGPSAIFMVLVFAMSSSMPATDVYGSLLRAALVASGSLLSMGLALMGWFSDPNRPERETIHKLYTELADLMAAIGTPVFAQKHADFIQVMSEANHILQSSYSGWHATPQYKILFHLNKRANRLWLLTGEQFAHQPHTLSPAVLAAFQQLAKLPEQLSGVTLDLSYSRSEERSIVLQLQRIERIINQPHTLNIALEPIKLPTWLILRHSFNRQSLAWLSAWRFGLVTLISALVAYSFEFPRSFWIPLSTVSVMSGVTILATVHRSIQRALGTILGVGIGTFLLSLNPNPYLIVFYVFFFCMMGEVFIVKNYGLTALFFTPSALIMAVVSSGMTEAAPYFAEIRIMDVLIGSAIGLVGIFIINPYAASKRVQNSMLALMRSQLRLGHAKFNGMSAEAAAFRTHYFYPLKISANNLNIEQQTMLGEIPKPLRTLEQNWPLLHELKQLNYLLERTFFAKQQETLPDADLAQWLLIYANMMRAIELNQTYQPLSPPNLKHFPLLSTQLNRVQVAVQQRQQLITNSSTPS